MASTIGLAAKTDPYMFDSKQAEGALTARSFVMAGTTDDEVKPITTGGNVAAVGYVDRAYADNDMVSVMKDGNLVECTCEGTVAAGGYVITGNGVGVVKAAVGDGTDNRVGRAETGNTTGLTVFVRLSFAPSTD